MPKFTAKAKLEATFRAGGRDYEFIEGVLEVPTEADAKRVRLWAKEHPLMGIREDRKKQPEPEVPVNYGEEVVASEASDADADTPSDLS